MKKLLVIGLFLAGLVVGAVTGGWWSWHIFSRLTVFKEVDAASIAAFQAEWLAPYAPGMRPSLEAQIVNAADELTYCAHDLDDGLRSGSGGLSASRRTKSSGRLARSVAMMTHS